MNILRLSTLSLTLAVAVFALGYNPSFADKPGSVCEEHCSHGGDDDLKTTYTVQMHPGTVGGNVVVAENLCAGTTGTTGNSIRSVRFRGPGNCGVVFGVPIIDSGPSGYVLDLKLTGLEMRAGQDVLAFKAAHLFFTSLTDGSIYTSDTVGASFIFDEDKDSFFATVNKNDVNLIKEVNPMKGQVVGPISVGTIEYTAN